MYIPKDSVASCIDAGDYLLGRLIHGRQADLVQPMDLAVTTLIAAVRKVEDLERPWRQRIAARDGCDEEMDLEVRQIRGDLSLRSKAAVKEAPYTLIFGRGIEYYTEAPQDEQLPRYTELAKRLSTYLPNNDPLLARVPTLEQRRQAWERAAKAVADSLSALALARTDRDRANDAWVKAYEATYGALVTRVGKAKAETFFPKAKSKKAKAEPAPESPAPSEPGEPSCAPEVMD